MRDLRGAPLSERRPRPADVLHVGVGDVVREALALREADVAASNRTGRSMSLSKERGNGSGASSKASGFAEFIFSTSKLFNSCSAAIGHATGT